MLTQSEYRVRALSRASPAFVSTLLCFLRQGAVLINQYAVITMMFVFPQSSCTVTPLWNLVNMHKFLPKQQRRDKWKSLSAPWILTWTLIHESSIFATYTFTNCEVLHIYDFIGNYMISGSDPQRAFKNPLWISKSGSVNSVAMYVC